MSTRDAWRSIPQREKAHALPFFALIQLTTHRQIPTAPSEAQIPPL